MGRGLWHHCPHFVAWGLRGRALYGRPTQSSALGVRDARTASGHFAGSHRDLDADPAPEIPNFGTGPIEPSVEPGCPSSILRRSGSRRLRARTCTCSCRMGPPFVAMPRARLVHQIAFATPTLPVTGTRRLHGNDLSVMNAFVGPLLAFGL